jgi:hypothetical protein
MSRTTSGYAPASSTVVTPEAREARRCWRFSSRIVASESPRIAVPGAATKWTCESIRPGSTVSPTASITFVPGGIGESAWCSSIPTMRSPSISMSTDGRAGSVGVAARRASRMRSVVACAGPTRPIAPPSAAHTTHAAATPGRLLGTTSGSPIKQQIGAEADAALRHGPGRSMRSLPNGAPSTGRPAWSSTTPEKKPLKRAPPRTKWNASRPVAHSSASNVQRFRPRAPPV